MKYIKKQKMITNIGGLILSGIVIGGILAKLSFAVILMSIIAGLGFYLYWRKYDEVEELKEREFKQNNG